jgi:DNA repair protein RecO (recombination protein O)
MRGVVLRRVDYGESDLILHLFTREAGRLSALARGARRSKKRFAGAIGLFTVSEFRLRNSAGKELWATQGATVLQSFHELASDVIGMAHASYGTELVRELTVAEAPDPELFDLLVELYSSLKEAGPRAGRLRVFELRLLGDLGLAPVLDRCASCGIAELGNAVMDPARGGALCRSCAATSRGTVRELPEGARELLLLAQRMDALAEGDVLEGREEASEARAAVLATLYHHVGKPLRSVEFIAKLAASR